MPKADNLLPYCAVVKKSGSLNFLEPSGPSRSVMGELFTPYFEFSFVSQTCVLLAFTTSRQ